jgi:CHAD domain-containing protein
VEDIEAMGAYADDPSRVLELHEMRIAAKKLRYTMELFAPFRDKWFSAAIERVKALQEALGEIHDTDVLIPRLITHARRELKGGIEPNGLGAYDVDLEGVAGLLRACKIKRADRDASYGRLTLEWNGLQLSGLLKKIADPEEVGSEEVKG